MGIGEFNDSELEQGMGVVLPASIVQTGSATSYSAARSRENALRAFGRARTRQTWDSPCGLI
eukprot:9432567-Pyramimonas_sp.AAC.1